MTWICVFKANLNYIYSFCQVEYDLLFLQHVLWLNLTRISNIRAKLLCWNSTLSNRRGVWMQNVASSLSIGRGQKFALKALHEKLNFGWGSGVNKSVSDEVMKWRSEFLLHGILAIYCFNPAGWNLSPNPSPQERGMLNAKNFLSAGEGFLYSNSLLKNINCKFL
jgi:hypothetical protein